MQRLRPVSTRNAAKPLRQGLGTGGARAKPRSGPKLPASAADYAACAVKVLASLMRYGEEPVRLAAAKAILQKGWGGRMREAPEPDPPYAGRVIYYVTSDDPRIRKERDNETREGSY